MKNITRFFFYITKPDKGNNIVMLDKSDYYSRMINTIEFVEIKKNPLNLLSKIKNTKSKMSSNLLTA